MSPRGRRPASSPDAREAILAAARVAFARDGYKTSLRGIARAAGVDSALVHHYFPNRAELFAQSVIASIAGENADLMERANSIIMLEPEQVGEGIVHSFITLWDTVGGENFTAVVRAAIEGAGGAPSLFEALLLMVFCSRLPQNFARIARSCALSL